MRIGSGVVDEQVLGAGDEAERHALERGHRPHVAAGRLRAGRGGLRVGRLEAETAWDVDGAEQHLQQVQCAAGVEAVGVGRDAAHRVHRDRAAAHGGVAAAGPVGPGDGELDRLVEGDVGELGGEAADGVGGNAAGRGDGVGGVARVEVALGDQLEDRHGVAAEGGDLAVQRRAEAGGERVGGRSGVAVPGERAALGVA
jgi:hypothetical protein